MICSENNELFRESHFSRLMNSSVNQHMNNKDVPVYITSFINAVCEVFIVNTSTYIIVLELI